MLTCCFRGLPQTNTCSAPCTFFPQTAKLEAIQRELHISNHRIPLSEEGTASAHQAGRALRHLLVHGHMPRHRQHHLQQQEEQVEQQQAQALLQDPYLQQTAAQQEPELVMAATALSSQRGLQAESGGGGADGGVGSYGSSPTQHSSAAQPGSGATCSSSGGTVAGSSSHHTSPADLADTSTHTSGSSSSSSSMRCFIYSSPYLRCIQTAQHVARVLDDSQVGNSHNSSGPSAAPCSSASACTETPAKPRILPRVSSCSPRPLANGTTVAQLLAENALQCRWPTTAHHCCDLDPHSFLQPC